MIKKQTARKKVVASKVGQRPVLQFRVHADVYAALGKAAGAAKRTLSEEAAKRIEFSLELDAGVGGPKRKYSLREVPLQPELDALVSSSGKPLADVCLERIKLSFVYQGQIESLKDSLHRKAHAFEDARDRVRDLERKIAQIEADQQAGISPGISQAIEEAVARGISRGQT